MDNNITVLTAIAELAKKAGIQYVVEYDDCEIIGIELKDSPRNDFIGDFLHLKSKPHVIEDVLEQLHEMIEAKADHIKSSAALFASRKHKIDGHDKFLIETADIPNNDDNYLEF